MFSSEGVKEIPADLTPEAASAVPKALKDPKEHRFQPYDFNGGTTLAIAGDDFAVIAVDTRLAEGYHILSRNINRSVQLTSACVLATGGCHTDVSTLHKVLDMRVKDYAHMHESEASTPAIAQLLGNTLYYRRFFPYYAFNVLAGVDAEGRGAVYTYDAVGSFERTKYACQGSGQKLIIPYLDNVVGFKSRTDEPKPLTVADAVNIAKDAFITAAERQIYVGDAIKIFVIVNGLPVESSDFAIKRD